MPPIHDKNYWLQKEYTSFSQAQNTEITDILVSFLISTQSILGSCVFLQAGTKYHLQHGSLFTKRWDLEVNLITIKISENVSQN
jgi:hypothetical protein